MENTSGKLENSALGRAAVISQFDSPSVEQYTCQIVDTMNCGPALNPNRSFITEQSNILRAFSEDLFPVDVLGENQEARCRLIQADSHLILWVIF